MMVDAMTLLKSILLYVAKTLSLPLSFSTFVANKNFNRLLGLGFFLLPEFYVEIISLITFKCCLDYSCNYIILWLL